MPPRPRTGADALVAQLEALRVAVVFGIPGVHNLGIFDALRRSSIRTVVVRHEQAAAYAADGYARATGGLGVCITTTGPGAANTVAAIGEARASRVPVLQISTQIETALLEARGGRFSLHESPHQQEMMDAVSAWSGAVARADAIPSMIVKAAQSAFAGRRGPAFVEIPHDLLAANVRAAAARRVELYRPVRPEPAHVERAARTLADARRPVIWAGGGAVSAGAADALAGVAERIGAPVVTTFAGKGLLPPSHPLSVGLPPHQPQVAKLLADADGVLIVGSDLDGMNTQGWRTVLARPRVSINTVAQDARRNYSCEVVVEADARLVLEALQDVLPERDGAAAAKRVASVRTAVLRWLRAHREFAAPFEFIERLAAIIPPDHAVLADMAVAGYWSAAYYPAPAPRTFMFPLGWGTLGWAFPASLGVAASGRRAVVVCGDGGFLFAPGELATAVQESLPVVVVLVNDGGYGMIRYDQDDRFGARFGADLTAPDFVALARAFGAKARRSPLADLEASMGWALKQEGPVLLEVPAAFPPPITTSPRWPLKGKPEARP